MFFLGREIDPIDIWSEYVEFPPGTTAGPRYEFLPKVKCPNPNHATNKRHFQVNAKQATVHCFAHCGISGTYEHALCVMLGIYEERGVTESDLELARRPWSPKMPEDVKAAKDKRERAWSVARKIILKSSKLATSTPRSHSTTRKGTRKMIPAEHERELVSDERRFREGEFRYLPEVARDYLAGRGIEVSSRSRWKIGWDADEERVVLPAFDERDRFRFLIRRSLKAHDSVKYTYTPGSIKTSLLYGACHLDAESVKSLGLVLVEGPLDAIRLHQHGVTSAVAILGTGLSTRQAALIRGIRPRRVYFMFDKDVSGVHNIQLAKFRLPQFPLFVCRYPSGRDDPATLTREEAERVIERAVPINVFFSSIPKRAKNLLQKEAI